MFKDGSGLINEEHCRKYDYVAVGLLCLCYEMIEWKFETIVLGVIGAKLIVLW